ncbi:MAG: LysR family transcriptional regulator [Thermaurantiacus sp.]
MAGPGFDWNDLRHFLAVAASGSTLAAGRSLRVSQTTVARRITALEDALGLHLFERLPSGYLLTGAGEALLPLARELEAAATAIADHASASARALSGTVRITLEEVFATTLLLPMLADLRQAHPGIMVEVDASVQQRDLAAGAADIALRNIARPSGAGLVAQWLCDSPWTFYCSEDYAARHGRPASYSEMRQHVLVAGGGDVVAPIYEEWLARTGLLGAVAMRHGSISGLLAAVRSGAGIAALPCLVADFEPGLLRCMEPVHEQPSRGLWLLYPERHRSSPHVRVVVDHLAGCIRALARESAARPA